MEAEIEITEAMTEAGAAILEADPFVREATLEVSRRELARAVYLAMLSAKTE